MKNWILVFLLGVSFSAFSQLRLPSFLDSHMVLQQKKVNRIWGWASPGQLVKVSLAGRQYQSIAGSDGT